jgi:hypothetical protein
MSSPTAAAHAFEFWPGAKARRFACTRSGKTIQEQTSVSYGSGGYRRKRDVRGPCILPLFLLS